jgi:MFS family permease
MSASTPHSSSSTAEKGQTDRVEELNFPNAIATGPTDIEYEMTWKTWWVIFILSATFGLSFWPVPTTAALQTQLGIKWGASTAVYWFIPAYTSGCALGFLIAGANSDLFGRRLFLIAGHVLCCVGFIISAASKGPTQFTAGLAICGFGGGFCQMAMCSIPGAAVSLYYLMLWYFSLI